jgi:hypothetical protein
MGFYKSSPPPPPQPLAKRKEQEPKLGISWENKTLIYFPPIRNPQKVPEKLQKQLPISIQEDMKRLMIELQHAWVEQRGGGGGEPDHLSPQITPNNPPSLTHSTFPSLRPYLPPSLPSHGWPHGSATKVEGHKRLCCAAARFSNKNWALFPNFGPLTF